MRTVTSKIQTRALLILVAFGIAYLFYAIYQEKFDSWNALLTDHLSTFRTRPEPLSDNKDSLIIHVNANLNAYRSQHAQVIYNLSSMKVATLVFDHIFSERVGDEEDLPLMAAASEAGNIIFGMAFESFDQNVLVGKDTLPRLQQEYLDSQKWVVKVEGNAKRFVTVRNPKLTYPALASTSSGLGFINIIPDPDGILRRVPLMAQYQDTFYPSIAFRAICHYLNITPDRIIIHPGKSIVLKDVRRPKTDSTQDLIIPIDARGNMILNYDRKWQNVQQYSYGEILHAHETDEGFQQFKTDLKEKIVVMSEMVETPIRIRPITEDNNLSFGAIHTIIMQNLLDGSFFKELSRTEMVLIELALIAVLFFMSARFSAPMLSLGTILLAASYVMIAASSFVYGNLIFQFSRPLVILFGALLLLLIASAIEKAILLAETERARKLAERELEIGRKIQTGFFPKTLPNRDGWEIVTHFQAARHVAGDFYDAFSIGKKENLGIVVADVCDKGVGAALFMALFRSLIRVLSGSTVNGDQLADVSLDHRPTKILKHTIISVNNYISTTHEADAMFSTIFFGILNPTSGMLYYITCGHEPPMIINDRGVKASLSPTGPAVGLSPNAAFDVHHIRLEPEDVLLAYTDGVTDAQNLAGANFSRLRLTELATGKYPSAKALVNKIVSEIKDYNIGQDQFDDITILALRREKTSD